MKANGNALYCTIKNNFRWHEKIILFIFNIYITHYINCNYNIWSLTFTKSPDTLIHFCTTFKKCFKASLNQFDHYSISLKQRRLCFTPRCFSKSLSHAKCFRAIVVSSILFKQCFPETRVHTAIDYTVYRWIRH